MFSKRCDEFLNFYFENKTNSGLFQTMFAILDDLLFFLPTQQLIKGSCLQSKAEVLQAHEAGWDETIWALCNRISQ